MPQPGHITCVKIGHEIISTVILSFSTADSSRAVVSIWQKNVHLVLVNCLGGLSLPRKSVSRLTDRLDHDLNSADRAVTLDTYNISQNS